MIIIVYSLVFSMGFIMNDKICRYFWSCLIILERTIFLFWSGLHWTLSPLPLFEFLMDFFPIKTHKDHWHTNTLISQDRARCHHKKQLFDCYYVFYRRCQIKYEKAHKKHVFCGDSNLHERISSWLYYKCILMLRRLTYWKSASIYENRWLSN